MRTPSATSPWQTWRRSSGGLEVLRLGDLAWQSELLEIQAAFSSCFNVRLSPLLWPRSLSASIMKLLITIHLLLDYPGLSAS